MFIMEAELCLIIKEKIIIIHILQEFGSHGVELLEIGENKNKNTDLTY